MSPRSGGEADKLGNHYEGAWTIRQLIDVLLNHADAITVEQIGEIGEGIEFTIRRSTGTEVHQVKRQYGNANHWTLGVLHEKGVLDSARRHVAAGRDFHFVSIIPARDLDELTGRARRSDDLQPFVDDLSRTETLTQRFNYLADVYGSPQVAWETLRGTAARCVDERELRSTNAALAGLLLAGAFPLTAAVALGDLIIENLATTLDRDYIVSQLPRYGLGLSGIIGASSIASAVGSIRTSWVSSVERELLEPVIPRAEAEQIMAELADKRCLFAIGSGGVGKSGVLLDVLDQAESADWAVLPFRLDRQEPFSSTVELGQRFNLEVSPVSALAAVAQERSSLLIIDQLDAVSKASGRMPVTFDTVADLVRETVAFPNMRVLLACRKFDVDNDDRIRTLIKEQGTVQSNVGPLSTEQTIGAIAAMGINPDQLTQKQKDLLRTPLHLRLLSSIADQLDAFSFTTTTELFDAYWDRKRRDCLARRQHSVRFGDVIRVLANEMSMRQSLTVSRTILDDDDLSADADVLASEHVLVIEGRKVSFFHESFFDYAFARVWTRQLTNLVQFLRHSEQELFRRSQVRQVLVYLHEDDPDRFVTEMEALLAEPDIRFHIKDVVLALLRALQAPTADEWAMVERLLSQGLPFNDRLWSALRTSSWFDRLDSEGVIADWLASSDEGRRNQALDIMARGAKARPDRMAELLRPHALTLPDYHSWLRWITRFASVAESRALLELVLDAIRRGHYAGYDQELFHGARDLAEREPLWAVELLVAHLVDRPDALALDSSGSVSALLSREHGAIRLTTAAAARAPREFCEHLVPYLLQVAEVTEYPRDEPLLHDRQFGFRHWEEPYHQLDQALLAGILDAGRRFAQLEPATARPVLQQLAGDPHETSQWLLYEMLAAAGESHASYAATLLLDRDFGLRATESWTVRRVVQAISPHVSSEIFARLEAAVLSLGGNGDQDNEHLFLHLSALAEGRLSETARVELVNLRGRYGVEQPAEPKLLSGGVVRSPIAVDSAHQMTDSEWLQAMKQYDVDRMDWVELTGGAVELSHVFKDEVQKDPARFARLVIEFAPDIHPSYADAALRGLGDSDVPVEPGLVFDAVRHIASLRIDAVNRWLGWALRRHLASDIPDDIVRLLLELALHSSDPPSFSNEGSEPRGGSDDDLLTRGINSTRGHAVEMLGDILVHDADGRRTALVLPALAQLAGDPSVAVRACAAHLIAACLRHAAHEAIQAFAILIDTDERLLATRHVERLIGYVGRHRPDMVEPVIRRMIVSSYPSVCEVGGRLAAFAGLELGLADLLEAARTATQSRVRVGAAAVCAGLLPRTSNTVAAGEAIRQFMNDSDEKVQEAVASVASVLRGSPLRPFRRDLNALITSPAFTDAAIQLLITLEHAPDRVDDLIIACARRFVDVYGSDAADISTHAAADAPKVGGLLLRAYAQASDVHGRAAVLDLIDELLGVGAYGLGELVDAAER